MPLPLCALFLYVAYYTIRYGGKVWGSGKKPASLSIFFIAACILGLTGWHLFFS